MKIVMMGSGGIGGYFGGRLATGGADVHFVARGSHLEAMRSHGLTAKQSSIHVNGWFGDYDKLAMTRAFLREAFSLELDIERERCVFVGDSPNDAAMFAFFPHAVGVANVRTFFSRIPTPPAFITHAEAGNGFAELAYFLLEG